jgi:sulfatase maturation enzyme AslB (radical SAM superfamily)
MSESSRPYSKLSDGRTLDPLFGPVWIKETKGMKPLIKDLKGKYCQKLYTWLEVDMWGKAWMCCPSWLPYPIGNVLTDSIDEMWNGERAKELRNQIFTGNWKYCQHEFCPLIASDVLPNLSDIQNPPESTVAPLPTNINFSNDESCNLKCPSCRTDKLLFTEGPLYERRKEVNDKIYEMLFSEPTDRHFSIHVTGSGDPFASKIYREMLQKLDGKDFPNLTVNLQTNGVMFTPKNWDRINKIHTNLRRCAISFDAGTKDTYENVTRIGGDWELLISNCKFLDAQVENYPQFDIVYDFVVQADNFKEMRRYIKTVDNFFPNAGSINFSLVTDWGTWPKEVYEQKCIWKDTHPEHGDLLKVLKDSIFKHPKVNLGNLQPMWEKANGL